jgi:hypothetical protein
MISISSRKRSYQLAHERLLKPVIVNFFANEFQGMFGPIVRENIADALIRIFEENCPDSTKLKSGQMLWNALDKNTHARSQKRRYKPVILTIVSDEEISMFAKGESVRNIKQKVIARIINEAYEQGGILSMRDISLLLATNDSYLSELRINYETRNNIVLPHTGVLHDMGSCISHKYQIIYKYAVQKKGPRTIAFETKHSQAAVDRYIKDFNRIKTLTSDGKDLEYIHLATNIAKHVIIQYQKIINHDVK